ncbi:hypothetical protein MA16_Dca006454 [Dendrobium catenatum]|uniref:Uncharacterized protein n=1 Tax=Dendrobium catenatum TaxID=906689 RepID=A0A2I0X7S9_9ASPA|nr:hypothetical protein MA16_Dca006454 [Dendrobium catenatum]
MADPDLNYGIADDEQGFVHILHSTFFDVNPNIDNTVEEYVERILDTLIEAIEEQLSAKMGAESYVNGLKALDFGMHTKLLANHNKTLKERIVTVEGKLLHDLKIAMQKNKELTEKHIYRWMFRRCFNSALSGGISAVEIPAHIPPAFLSCPAHYPPIELLQKRLKDADKEQETIVTIFLEERERRDAEEEKWRTLLKVANDKINKLENFAISGIKSELQ